MKRATGRFNRRRFLGTTVVATVPWILPAAARAEGDRPAPSGRVTLGVVGAGSRGFNLINDFLREPDAQIVAVCDVDTLHYRDRPWGQGSPMGLEPAKRLIERRYAQRTSRNAFQGVDTYSDFRELCGRKDLDAVVVATPDHWHALIALEALRNDKDVYCEKPLTHRFREGQLIYREAARRKAVFQVGSQQRSDARFRRAVELIRNGHIGPVRRVEVGLPTGYDKPQGDPTVRPVPDHLDYDFWCGPAPELPYMRARHHRWWRGHLAFGGGVLMDWIGHHNDIAHWALAMDNGGPTKVEAVGWVFPKTDVYNTPEHYEIHCEYPGGIVTSIADKNRLGTKWIGPDGWVFVSRGRLEASDRRWCRSGFDPGPIRVYRSPRHAGNFLDCIQSRKPCVAPPETAHRSITPGHLGYVSHALKRPLRWDAQAEKVLDDPEAQTMLMKIDYRKPWQLEG